MSVEFVYPWLRDAIFVENPAMFETLVEIALLDRYENLFSVQLIFLISSVTVALGLPDFAASVV